MTRRTGLTRIFAFWLLQISVHVLHNNHSSIFICQEIQASQVRRVMPLLHWKKANHQGLEFYRISQTTYRLFQPSQTLGRCLNAPDLWQVCCLGLTRHLIVRCMWQHALQANLVSWLCWLSAIFYICWQLPEDACLLRSRAITNISILIKQGDAVAGQADVKNDAGVAGDCGREVGTEEATPSADSQAVPLQIGSLVGCLDGVC